MQSPTRPDSSQPHSHHGNRLEDEFFFRVDQELWQQMREKAALERRIDALRDASGIDNDAVLAELVALDVGEDSLVALSLYPVVYVAWADGIADDKEKKAVLEAAGAIGCGPDMPGHQLLESWMTQQPTEKLFDAWGDYVRAVSTEISPEARETMKREVLARARKVAEASGGLLGIHTVSRAEEQALEELAKVFDELG